MRWRQAHQIVTEHPTETARRALREAAVVECQPWTQLMLQVAESLPERAEIVVDAA